MDTYIYSGLHPRTGTIPVHTFFPAIEGKPVVAMKSSIIIEGKRLQRVPRKEVEAFMDAYELFQIPVIHKTNQEYDYALLVENLDNDSVPDTLTTCILKSGGVMGIVIDHNPHDGTYTVGCGPQVLTKVTSDFTCMNPPSEFPCVQIQRSFDSCGGCHNICDGAAEIKKLLDPMVATTSQESSHHSAKPVKGHVTPTLAAMSQAQSNPTKSSKLVASTPSESSVSRKSPLPQTQKNPTQDSPFKPFTGWAGTLRSQDRIESSGGSNSSLSYESFGEDPWEIPESDDPFGKYATTSIVECIREQGKKSATKRSNLNPSTSSARSLRCKSIEEDPLAIPDESDCFGKYASLSFFDTLLAQSQKGTAESSQCAPSTTSPSLRFLKSLYPQAETNCTKSNNREPSASSSSSSFLESLYPPAQNNSMTSSNLTLSTSSARPSSYKSPNPQALNNSTTASQLTSSTSSASSLLLESLYPRAQNSQHNPFANSASSIGLESLAPRAQRSQFNPFSGSSNSLYNFLAPHDPSLIHTSTSTENKPTIQPAAGACSQMPLEDFEALKPTLSSHEKGNKMIEDFMTVTI